MRWHDPRRKRENEKDRIKEFGKFTAQEVSPLTPIAPTRCLSELYKAKPPPKTIKPKLLLESEFST